MVNSEMPVTSQHRNLHDIHGPHQKTEVNSCDCHDNCVMTTRTDAKDDGCQYQTIHPTPTTENRFLLKMDYTFQII